MLFSLCCLLQGTCQSAKCRPWQENQVRNSLCTQNFVWRHWVGSLESRVVVMSAIDTSQLNESSLSYSCLPYSLIFSHYNSKLQKFTMLFRDILKLFPQHCIHVSEGKWVRHWCFLSIRMVLHLNRNPHPS